MPSLTIGHYVSHCQATITNTQGNQDIFMWLMILEVSGQYQLTLGPVARVYGEAKLLTSRQRSEKEDKEAAETGSYSPLQKGAPNNLKTSL